MSNNNIRILVPNLPESVLDATVAVWHKKIGDIVQINEILLEIETDKIMLDIPSPQTGILKKILEKTGSIVKSGQTLGYLDFSDTIDKNQMSKTSQEECTILENNKNNYNNVLTPSVRKLVAEHDLILEKIKGSGMKGRLTRQDIRKHIDSIENNQETDQKNNENFDIKNLDDMSIYDQKNNENFDIKNLDDMSIYDQKNNQQKIKRVVMSRLRKKIAERLLNVTNTTATLTTFNEVNMSFIIKIRKEYGELFKKKNGIKLGMMSFYVKAVTAALQKFPEINASIDGEEIIYYNYFDISIAVATSRGLITPVLRNVNTLSILDIEKNIKLFSEKEKSGKLKISDLIGGNFTITNGGKFGSLLSTPIINPPQSAILGMHAIKDRPMVINGKIIILPMMYLALSYDHRLIDGKEAVNFLSFIKELIEDPTRLFLDL